jgi:ribosomal small subunit protein bTHX
MGKGDIKSKRGKISNGSNGKRRNKKNKTKYQAPAIQDTINKVVKESNPANEAQTDTAKPEKVVKKPAPKKVVKKEIKE